MRVKWKIQTIVMEVLLTINLHFHSMILYILLLPWMNKDYWRKTTVNAILIEQHWLLCDLKERILLIFNDISNYANWSPELVCCSMKCAYFWLRTRNGKDQKEKDQLACASYVHVSGSHCMGSYLQRIFPSTCEWFFWLNYVVEICSSLMFFSLRVYNWLLFIYRSVSL